MRLIDCFFWLDGDPEALETLVKCMCEKCHYEQHPWLGWPYSGPVGPWKFICGKCGTVILDGIEEEGQESEEEGPK